MKKEYSIGIVAFLVVVGGFFLFQNQGGGDTVPETAETVEIATDASMVERAGDDAMVEADYTLDLKNFSFTPALIEAEPGETITVKITNSQGFHDFVLDELNVASKQINQGDEDTFTITVPADLASGTEYEFYCSVSNHRQLGMVGVFRVK